LRGSGGRGPDARGGQGGAVRVPGPEINTRPFMVPGQPGLQGRNGPGSPQTSALRGQVIEIRSGDEQETRFGGAELASLSERLGSYFGVKTGVLVVRAGVDSPFKLQDGDVILAVDGREISSAQQAGRILRSYQPGEKLTLKVQRDRKVQNLEITAPGGRRPN
jgi:S1-C subfamily serine protease